MKHVNDLFTHASEPGQDAAEAFDAQLDYRLAQERKIAPATGRGLIGSFALLVTNEEKADEWQGKFTAWRERKRTERAERRAAKGKRRRAKYGNLDSLSFEDGTLLSTTDRPPQPAVYENARLVGEETVPDTTTPPRPVLGAPGVYRSNFSENQPDELPLSDAEYDDILEGAVSRARAALGEIPVAQMHRPTEDELLIERLEKAFGQPAQEPDRSGHTPQHHILDGDRDDQLTSTNA